MKIWINRDRLLDDLKTLRSIGACGTGVVRPAISSEDIKARKWLKQRFEELILAVLEGRMTYAELCATANE